MTGGGGQGHVEEKEGHPGGKVKNSRHERSEILNTETPAVQKSVSSCFPGYATANCQCLKTGGDFADNNSKPYSIDQQYGARKARVSFGVEAEHSVFSFFAALP